VSLDDAIRRAEAEKAQSEQLAAERREKERGDQLQEEARFRRIASEANEVANDFIRRARALLVEPDDRLHNGLESVRYHVHWFTGKSTDRCRDPRCTARHRGSYEVVYKRVDHWVIRNAVGGAEPEKGVATGLIEVTGWAIAVDARILWRVGHTWDAWRPWPELGRLGLEAELEDFGSAAARFLVDAADRR
jgi:hypothetical protein